jgi:hypothetical protein
VCHSITCASPWLSDMLDLLWRRLLTLTRACPPTTEEAVRYLGQGDMLLSDSFPGQDRNKLCLSSKVPLGVVLCIPPFNCKSPCFCDVVSPTPCKYT